MFFKMKFDWKRLFFILIIVVITAAAAGYSSWWGLTLAINKQKEQISSLENQVDILAEQLTKKIEEQKAKEAAEQAAAEAEANKPASKPKSYTPTPEPEEPIAVSRILFFYDPDCGACQIQMPIVLELQSEGVPFAFMNVDENPGYISQYGISKVPTFILNGARVVAVLTKAELLNFWNTYK